MLTEEEFLKGAFNGDLETVRKYVAEGGDVNVANPKGMSGLILAIWNGGNIDLVRFLLNHGASLSYRQESSGWRAFTFAAVNGHADMLRLLYDRGDSFDGKSEDWRALLFSVQFRNRATAAMLLEHGADPDLRDEEGKTSLMRASKNSDAGMVELLLEHGADPNLRDDSGMTALMYAAGKANVGNIELLCAKGADPRVENHAGARALEIAESAGKSAVAMALRRREAEMAS